jgi:hypothetical protein
MMSRFPAVVVLRLVLTAGQLGAHSLSEADLKRVDDAVMGSASDGMFRTP